MYYYTPEEEEMESETNDTCDRADVITLEKSTNTPTSTGALYAEMDGDDVSDCFRLRADDIGDLEGMYLWPHSGMAHGSLLDAKMSLYSDETAETLLTKPPQRQMPKRVIPKSGTSPWALKRMSTL